MGLKFRRFRLAWEVPASDGSMGLRSAVIETVFADGDQVAAWALRWLKSVSRRRARLLSVDELPSEELQGEGVSSSMCATSSMRATS